MVITKPVAILTNLKRQGISGQKNQDVREKGGEKIENNSYLKLTGSINYCFNDLFSWFKI